MPGGGGIGFPESESGTRGRLGAPPWPRRLRASSSRLGALSAAGAWRGGSAPGSGAAARAAWVSEERTTLGATGRTGAAGAPPEGRRSPVEAGRPSALGAGAGRLSWEGAAGRSAGRGWRSGARSTGAASGAGASALGAGASSACPCPRPSAGSYLPMPSRAILRRTRSAWASSMLEEWLLMPMPMSLHRSTAPLFDNPSSLASS